MGNLLNKNNSCGCGCNHNHEHHNNNKNKETCNCGHDHISTNTDNKAKIESEESCNCGQHHNDSDSSSDDDSDKCNSVSEHHKDCNCNNDNNKHKHSHINTIKYSPNIKVRTNRHLRKKRYILKGLNCAGCAFKIEDQVNALEEIAAATLNFTTSTLVIETDNINSFESIYHKIEKIVTTLEPDVLVIDAEAASNNAANNNDKRKEFILKGLGCAGCAAKIEHQVGSLSEVSSSVVNFTTSTLIVEVNDKDSFNTLIPKIKKIVTKLEPDVLVIDKSSEKLNDMNSEKTSINQRLINKKKITKLTIGSIFFGTAVLFKLPFAVELTLFILSYLLIGGEVVLKAFKNISKGQVFDENFLMVIATFGAFAIQEFPEAVAVMLFYEVGETFQDIAVNRSRKSIADLMDIRPDKANLKIGETIKEVSPEEVTIDDIIVVKPGEKIPLDGIVLEGVSMLDTSALTGESVPRKASTGNEVLSGFINKNGVLTIKVTKSFSESAVSKILDLVENAGSKKAKTEQFITKFARYYTPVVVFSAAALAVLPPLFIEGALFTEWFRRALIFLVVSCPCALVVSVPLGFFGGIGCASKNGILVKGGNYLEALNYVDKIVFDKTGTLTKGIFEVTEMKAVENVSQDELLEYAAYSEVFSNHPIAKSILKLYDKTIDKTLIKDYSEIAGHGIKSIINGQEVLTGNAKLMEKYNISFEKSNAIGTIVYAAVAKKFIGYIVISDKIKTDSESAINELKNIGISKTIMLTGDSKTVGESVAKKLNIDKAYTELLPQNKVEILEDIINESNETKKVAFVGDGVNDAPVLARADVGIAMGGLGSDAAIEAADIVLMTDEPSKLATAIKIAKNTRRIVMQNIIFALGIKLAVLILATFGMANMWIAVFADVGVALLAVMNSMRILKTKV